MLNLHDPAGGDPDAFADHISFLSMMNEKRGDAETIFGRVRDALSVYSPGTVIFFGPGNADMWWPDSVGSAGNATWQRRSYAYFNALTEGGKHPYIRGDSALSQLDLRTWVSNAGRQCYDHHFQDTPSNSVKMTLILKNLAVFTQMLGNLFEVAAQTGHLPTESMGSMVPRWISKNPNFGRQEETPSALLALTNTSNEDQDLENCTKLAALAGIQLPAVGALLH